MQNTLRNLSPRFARFLLVSSKDGIGTPCDFMVSLNNIQGAQERIIQIVPRNAVLVNTFYNITSYTNVLRMIINGIEVQATVPVGRYTLSSFQDYLNETFIMLATFTLTPTPQGTIQSQCTETHSYITSSIGKILGITTNTASSTIVTFDSVANFNYPSTIVCRADFAHGQTMDTSQANSNIFDVMENDAAFGAILHHTHNDIDIHSIEFSDARNIATMKFRLTDESNNTLECAPGSLHTFVFKVFFA